MPPKEIISRLIRYFGSYKSRLAVALIAAALVSGMDSVMMLGVGMVMDLFSGISQALISDMPANIKLTRDLAGHQLWNFKVDGVESARTLLWIISGITLGIVVVKGAIHFTKEWLLWSVTHRILMKMKEQLFSRIVMFPMRTFDREKSGEMLSRITYDVNQMQQALRTGTLLLKSAVEAIIYVTMLFLLQWKLTLFAVFVFPLSAMMIKLFGESIRRYSGAMSRNVADYTSFLSEAIAGSKIIKAFGREDAKKKSFIDKIYDNFRHNMKIARVDAIHSPIQEFISTAGMIGVIIFCGYRLMAGDMTLGSLTTFVAILNLAYKPIKKLGTTNTVIQRAIASGNQIFQLLDEPVEDSIIGSGTAKPSPVTGALKFSEVYFEYVENKTVLRGINLDIKAGETVALVGPSGGGKSTIINLIPRFYPLKRGKIELDSINTADYDVEYLRSLISIVPQETILFAGTVEENILFSRPGAAMDQIVAAARAANAHYFIERLPDGYQTEVGERGVQLSGGQRQRIAIARAVLRDPRILLLDEATSALDTESEKLIQEALDRIRKERTTIIVAHRLSTILNAGRIAVIDDGRIVEIGSHAELFALEGVYRRFYEMQFAGAG